MDIVVIGTGYIGLVTGTAFAELGHTVTCLDVDGDKIEKLTLGISPIYEPGFEELIHRNQLARRLHFSTSLKTALPSAEVVFIAVGTPSRDDGSVKMKYVEAVASEIGEHLDHYVVVNKSTMPIGTGMGSQN